jgi:hypothetical protein
MTEEGEGDEEEDEEDPEAIKDMVTKLIAKKWNLSRTSVSLRWNLTAISIFVLHSLKAGDL